MAVMGGGTMVAAAWAIDFHGVQPSCVARVTSEVGSWSEWVGWPVERGGGMSVAKSRWWPTR